MRSPAWRRQLRAGGGCMPPTPQVNNRVKLVCNYSNVHKSCHLKVELCLPVVQLCLQFRLKSLRRAAAARCGRRPLHGNLPRTRALGRLLFVYNRDHISSTMRCHCGLEARVGHAQKHGRPYASCAAWPNGGCGYYRWLVPAPAPPTPDRSAACAPPPPAAAAALTPSPQQHRKQTKAAPQGSTPASPGTAADSQAAHACVRAFLIVRAAPASAAGQESVSLVLLPGLELPPAACAVLYEPAGERRLPHAPAAAGSLQPPYVCLQSWAPAAAAWEGVRRCIAGSSSGSGGGSEESSSPLFVLDTETTGFSSELNRVCCWRVCIRVEASRPAYRNATQSTGTFGVSTPMRVFSHAPRRARPRAPAASA